MKLASARSGAICLLASLLQSCGGGGGGDNGGGGNPPPPPPGNAIALSEGVAEPVAILSFGPTGDALQSVQILAAATRLLHQEVLVPQDLQCTSSGRVRLSVTDNDFNGALSAGDRVVVAYTDCNQSIRGNLELAITQIAFESSNIVSLDGDVTLDFNLIGIVDGRLTASGELSYRATSTQLRWSGSGFRVAFSDTDQTEAMTGGRFEKIYFGADQSYTLTLSGVIDSDALRGTFTFATQQAFAGIEGAWPTSGRLVATGSNDSQIAFRPAPEPDLLAYDIDADGNGQFEVTNLGIAWAEVAPPYLFGVPSGPGGQEPPPEPPSVDAVGRRIELGARGGDLQVDTARGKIYVTVPDRNELVVLSAQTLAVEQRVIIGSRPTNMSFTLDGEELLIALSAAGEVQILDLDTFASSRIFVAPALQTSYVNNVVETSPGSLFVATGDTAFGRIARIDRATGDVTDVPFFGGLHEDAWLVADPANGWLYAGDGSSLYKFDATDPLVPVLLEDDHGSIGGTEYMSLSPDGSRIYLESGQVLDTSTFTVTGTIAHGSPSAADNGLDVVVGQGDATLFIHSAQTLEEIDSLTTDCALDSESHIPPDVDRIAPSPVGGQWLMMGGTILCAVDLINPRQRPGTGQPGIPPAPPPTVNVPVIDLPLGAEAFDAEFDDSRNRIYVSLPSSGEVVTIDAATRQIVERDPLGNAPRGLDLSPDESTLAIMFFGNGHIGYKDIASGQTATTDLTSFLFVPKGHDVAYVNDDAIFASAEEPGGETYLVKTSRLNPNQTLRVTGGEFLRDRPELAASPNGLFLFGTERDQDLHKFDLSQPDAPLVLEGEVDNFFGADRVSVSPDSALIALRNGQVMRTGDFTQAGQVGVGVPLFSREGSRIYSAGMAGRIDRFSSSNFVATQRIQSNCSIGDPRRLLSNANEDVLITVGQSRLCFWLLGQQAVQSVKIGPHSRYVCDAGCLVRRYQKASGSAWFGSFRVHSVKSGS